MIGTGGIDTLRLCKVEGTGLSYMDFLLPLDEEDVRILEKELVRLRKKARGKPVRFWIEYVDRKVGK